MTKMCILTRRFFKKSLPQKAVCALALIFSTGCTPKHYMRGYIFPPQKIENLIHNGMDQASVLQVLGTPVLVDPLQPNRWIYSQTHAEQQAFHHPRVLSQKTLVMTFTPQGTLENFSWVDPKLCLNIVPDPGKTKIVGRDITELQQMFQGVYRTSKR